MSFWVDERTPATLEEIRLCVALALASHPLCHDVKFDIVSVPRTRRGGNWTVTLQSIEPRAVREASEIVADIQDTYDLMAADLTAAA